MAPEDGSLYDPKHVGVTRILDRRLVCFNKYWNVHELVTVNTDRINARFNYEILVIVFIFVFVLDIVTDPHS